MISVVGLGYIGLPTALILAANGNKVVGTDTDPYVTGALNEGRLHFSESGLTELFGKAISKDIRFTNDYIQADVYIIAVPTPYTKVTRKVDMHYVLSAIDSVLSVCPEESLIVIESTIPPGSIDRYIRPLLHNNVRIAHAPERIIPGNMLFELENNSRTIGVDDADTGKLLADIYGSFCNGEMIITDIRTAEMTKVVENTYRDINIAFANEMAKICRSDDLDVYKIIEVANKHPRVNILSPGPGVGGHCISVDPWFLVGDYPGLANIVLAARKINDSMPEYVLARIRDILSENRKKDTTMIGFYGITYKENVDDTRESPTIQIYEEIRRHLGGDNIRFYDPLCKDGILQGQMSCFDDFLDSCELIVIMVGHDHIKENMDKLDGMLILDTRNICNIPGCYKL